MTMTNTITNVPRELLERARAAVASTNTSNWSSDLLRDIHAILSAPSPAGVDGLEVVSNWVLFDAEADKPYIKKMLPEGFLAFFDCEEDARRAKANNPGTDYKRIDRVKAEDAQAIIDGLRGEIEVMTQHANNYSRMFEECAEERDHLAQCLKFARTTMAVVADNANLRGVEHRSLIAEIKRIDAALASGHEVPPCPH